MTDSPVPAHARRFSWAEAGSLVANLDADRKRWAASVWRAMRKEGEDLKAQLRKDVRAARFRNGGRLANAWRGQMFPRIGTTGTLNPAYAIGNQAANVLDTFEKGAVITARDGALLIPVGPARRIKLRIGQPRSDLIHEARALYGGQLSTRRLRKSGELALGAYTIVNGKQRFVPLFILRRTVTAPDLLDATGIMARWQAGLGDRVQAEAGRLFALESEVIAARAAA